MPIEYLDLTRKLNSKAVEEQRLYAKATSIPEKEETKEAIGSQAASVVPNAAKWRPNGSVLSGAVRPLAPNAFGSGVWSPMRR